MIKVAQIVADVFAVPIDARAGHRDAHRQGAQHLGHRGLVGRRPERHGRVQRGDDDPRPARRVRRRAIRRRDGEVRFTRDGVVAGDS